MQKYFKCYYFKDAKELKPVASIIYMMFINRAKLNHFISKNGYKYIKYSIKDIIKNIPCKASRSSILRALSQLESMGLIVRHHTIRYSKIELPKLNGGANND